MKSRAAVAFEPGKPLQIVEIDVEPPRKGEVLVKITLPPCVIPMPTRFQGWIPRAFFRPSWVMKVVVSWWKWVRA